MLEMSPALGFYAGLPSYPRGVMGECWGGREQVYGYSY